MSEKGQAIPTLEIPGTTQFAAAAWSVIDELFWMDPSAASGAGLYDRAARIPSFSPASEKDHAAKLESALISLKTMPWRTWDVDRQIDWRWVVAQAEMMHRLLMVERPHTHRPAAWLEPVSNNYINLLTYVPERQDLRSSLTAGIPDMVREIRSVCTEPTARDQKIADGILEGLIVILKNEHNDPRRTEALAAVEKYRADLAAMKPAKDFVVVGPENYAWRLKHALLLPWSPEELRALAEKDMAKVDAEMAALPEPPKEADASEDDLLAARTMTPESLLTLYDTITVENMAFLKKSGLIGVPSGVGPLKCRPTPQAMIPLTGDGGSMNPPPPMGSTDIGWWNVENYSAEWTQEEKLQKVLAARRFKGNGMGPYAVHEGVPGHHLQLSLARLNPNPLRKILLDNVLAEGWALYAEKMFQEAGGLGPSVEARRKVLGSLRYRILRVLFSVPVECGAWSLQDAADFKQKKPKGEGSVDTDILRTVNWPTQLISYFSGRAQILALKEDCQKAWGASYSDRRFHDELLAVGTIPLVFARAKLLGEPVPPL